MYQNIASRFVELLQLPQQLVGLAFVEEVPSAIQHVAHRVPSACTFWRLGEQGVFWEKGL